MNFMSNIFFPGNLIVCEIMWKTNYCGAKLATDNIMRRRKDTFAFRITKARIQIQTGTGALYRPYGL